MINETPTIELLRLAYWGVQLNAPIAFIHNFSHERPNSLQTKNIFFIVSPACNSTAVPRKYNFPHAQGMNPLNNMKQLAHLLFNDENCGAELDVDRLNRIESM